jgi:hypothetical protein
VRRVLLATLVALVVGATPASAQAPERSAVVVIVHGASMPELLEVPDVRSLATTGGVALMNGRSGARSELKALSEIRQGDPQLSIADVRGVVGLTRLLDEIYLLLRPPILIMIVSVSACTGATTEG